MLSFAELDKIFEFLPLEISGEIFEFYDTRCYGCGAELVLCNDCEMYFCQIHICFNHKTCNVCSEHMCPFKKFERICNCHENVLCSDCYYLDIPFTRGDLLMDLLTMTDSLEDEIEN